MRSYSAWNKKYVLDYHDKGKCFTCMFIGYYYRLLYLQQTVQRCPDGRPPERSRSGGYKFCGRGPGREDCGRGFYCEIHPTDRYAICCRRKRTPGRSHADVTYN